MSEYEDAMDRTKMLRSEDKIRIAFAELGANDPVCNTALRMALHDNYPLAAGLFIALEHVKKERDRLRDLVLDHNMKHPAPIRLDVES